MTDEITLDAPETRLERFLAAAAGVEGITLDEPETRIERYLYKIAQGGGGSGGGVLVVHDVDGTLDKTWKEIHDAIAVGTPCFVMEDLDGITIQLVTAVFIDSGSYYAAIGAENTGSYKEYAASSEDDYPTWWHYLPADV